ncbi:hypothetical protein NE237_000812 [Protea cynaroides]|uniref:Malectin-like domain-containing protein n=1 Tax=Protea cynaroides TaxID=273540 RepID=A0A9Q0KSU1_9MAGN|nr:hypothetical protein NE237_000812 [Protea cynaroides]
MPQRIQWSFDKAKKTVDAEMDPDLDPGSKLATKWEGQAVEPVEIKTAMETLTSSNCRPTTKPQLLQATVSLRRYPPDTDSLIGLLSQKGVSRFDLSEMVEMKTVERLPLILSVLLVLLNTQVSFAAFAPADNYLIACGSPQNVTFQGRTFVPDSVQFYNVLKDQGNSMAAISSSNVPSPIYQSARVFTSQASYKFKIQQEGRHWALVLYPSSPFCDLSDLALETVFRLNMGGPLLTPQNDTLSRIWEEDRKYLYVNSSAVNASVNPATIKYTMSVTPDTAPNWVYATAETMGDANVPIENFNISNDAGSLDGLTPVEGLLPKSSSNKSKIGIIVGSVLGTLAVMSLIALCYCCLAARKSKTTHQGHPWLPIPLYGNSLTMTKASTTSQKSGTGSCISLASSNFGHSFMFQEIMDATNKFDESLLLGTSLEFLQFVSYKLTIRKTLISASL